MEEKVIEETGGSISLRDILFVVKNNLIMIILFIVLSAGGGLGISYLVKPEYTASESVVYMADGEGGSTATYINVMNAYFDTVVDFCQTGVVVERANFYYVDYTYQQLKEPDLTLETYMARIKTPANDPYTINNEPTKNKEILKENIYTTVERRESDTQQFAFTISYKDKVKKESVEKLKFIIHAFDKEIKSTGIDGENKYFNGVNNNIISLGGNRVSSNVSKTKYTLFGGFVGVLLATGVLYLIKVLDKTVKDKVTFEQLTESTVITVLEYEGGNA